MSTRGNPFTELEQLFERMSRQFDDATHMWESDGPLARLTTDARAMAIDLVERDEEFVATVDLPGFERDDVDIRVTDHTLRIDAEREDHLDRTGERVLRHERHHESAQRSIRLPEEVDTDNVHATMNRGVLTITLPKLEIEQATTIEIEGE